MPTALAAVEAVFPGSRLTKSTLKRTNMAETSTVPDDAERLAVLDALRQAYALVAAQRRFVDEWQFGAAPPANTSLDDALTAIADAAKFVKGTA